MCERDIVILNKVVSKGLIEGVILIPEGSRQGDIWISGKTCYHFRPSETARRPLAEGKLSKGKVKKKNTKNSEKFFSPVFSFYTTPNSSFKD